MSIDIITYETDDGLPWYVEHCVKDKKEKGLNVLPLTPDRYSVPPQHAGYKHFKEITMKKLRDTPGKGIFICEGDVLLNDDVTIHDLHQREVPVWYGYKKITKNYIVGNFLIWIPKNYYNIIQCEIDKKKNRLLYSDRFFSQLVAKGIIKLHHKSLADEIEHHSNVIGKIRKGVKI
jgi:hypothetical protein